MNDHCDWMPELKGLLDCLQDGEFTEPDRLRLNDLLRPAGNNGVASSPTWTCIAGWPGKADKPLQG